MSRLVFRILAFALTSALGLLITESIAKADDFVNILSLTLLSRDAANHGRFDEALELGNRALRLSQGSPQTRGSIAEVGVLTHLSMTNFQLNNFTAAEAQVRRAMAIGEKTQPPLQPASKVSMLLLLGKIYQFSGLFAESIPVSKNAVELSEGAKDGAENYLAGCLTMLGDGYAGMGRYSEAQHLHQRALSVVGKNQAGVAFIIEVSLANDFTHQGRHADAVALLEKILKDRQAAGTARDSNTTLCEIALTNSYLALGRIDDAERQLLAGLPLAERTRQIPLMSLPVLQATLATIYTLRRQDDKAEAAYRNALDELQRQSSNSQEIAIYKLALANFYISRERWKDAKETLQQAIDIFEKYHAVKSEAAECWFLLAMLESRLGNSKAVIPAFERGFVVYNSVRRNAAGDPQDLGGNLAALQCTAELLPLTYAVRGDTAKALRVLESLRAQVLLGQMRSHGAGPLAGVPREEASRLGRKMELARISLTEITAKLGQVNAAGASSIADQERRRSALEDELKTAQAALVEARREVYNAGRVYRLTDADDFEPVSLPDLQKMLNERQALLLHYTVNPFAGCLMSVGPQGSPTIVSLSFVEEKLRRMGVVPEQVTVGAALNQGLTTRIVGKPTSLTSDLLHAAFVNKDGTGILQELSRPKMSEALRNKLADLADLLIPKETRDLLTSGRIRELIIVPDGPLSLLPFEALVMERGDDPRYLLDVGPPVSYAPSATVYWNLARRQMKPGRSVLTLGDAVYGTEKQSVASAMAELKPRARYRAVRSSLSPLPFSGQESLWVSQVFTESGLLSERLQKQQATEAWVRSRLPGRKIVHLACHGLVDDTFGNRFGALALTPGPNASVDPADDGYLSLEEIYDLDLKDCELAILSACETNYGPQQQGEGIWSLSRGFLVAGARRVVASNWLVDDEAAASLISYFCGGLARGMGKSVTPDYAKRLHEAKKWVRKQEKWQSPYYWGGFVIVGPN